MAVIRWYMTLVLPHPPLVLRPNGRGHWTKRAAAVRVARFLAWRKVRENLQNGLIVFKPTHYRVRWFYKGITPDADNCLAACKAYLDGAADAFSVNDRTLECAGINRVHDKARAGELVLRFSAPAGEEGGVSYG